MKKVVLAFSGGLDTSYCARYLAVDLGLEVHTVFVHTGGFNAEELHLIQQRAESCGVASHATIDRREELYSTVLRYCIAGNVVKNNSYPLSVSAERFVQAKAIAEHAIGVGAEAIAHGSTGAGNDQIRFDSVFRTLCPHMEIITPIRDQSLSREEEIIYLNQHDVQGDWTKAAYSINQGLWGTSVGGRETLTSHKPLPESAYPSSAITASTSERKLTLEFTNGEPTAMDGVEMEPVALIEELNTIGSTFRIGRDIHVGDTILGIKGRVGFEAPAATMLIKAHHALEKHTLSKWQLNLKDQLSVWYAQLLHEGQFLDEAMRSIEAFFVDTQRYVSGTVELVLRQHSFSVNGVMSSYDLMNSSVALYGEKNNSWTHTDARGFAVVSSIATHIQHERTK